MNSKAQKADHLIQINACIKRLKRPHCRMGLFYRRMYPPFRTISVSDASSANKASDFATEGSAVGTGEDRLPKHLTTDQHDYLAE